jgi:hypothetical protein
VRSGRIPELITGYLVDIADRYGSVSNSWCQGFAQDRHGGGYACYIMMNRFKYCWVIYSDTLQLGHWLNHVNVLYRLDRSTDDNAAGRYALTRGWSMGRCGGGGQNAGSHWACFADGRRARAGATKIDFCDTAASSQQLDKSLLVSLVDLGIQSSDRGNDIRANAGLRNYIQRGPVSMDFDGWTGSGMGPTYIRQRAGNRWRGRGIGPGEMFTPGVELQLSGLQFLLLDVEGLLLGL